MHHHRYSLYEEIHVTPNLIPLVDRQDDRTSNILPEEKIRVIDLLKLPAYHYWFHLDVCPCWRYSVCVFVCFSLPIPDLLLTGWMAWYNSSGFLLPARFPSIKTTGCVHHGWQSPTKHFLTDPCTQQLCWTLFSSSFSGRKIQNNCQKARILRQMTWENVYL